MTTHVICDVISWVFIIGRFIDAMFLFHRSTANSKVCCLSWYQHWCNNSTTWLKARSWFLLFTIYISFFPSLLLFSRSFLSSSFVNVYIEWVLKKEYNNWIKMRKIDTESYCLLFFSVFYFVWFRFFASFCFLFSLNKVTWRFLKRSWY